LVKSVHLEQNVLARNKTFLPGTKYSCLQNTTSPAQQKKLPWLPSRG
jgi:hypothetical protein